MSFDHAFYLYMVLYSFGKTEFTVQKKLKKTWAERFFREIIMHPVGSYET